ncbi:MAG: hypothetical protein ACI89X_002496, partial [Planctomycetota bacterium]
CLTEAQCDPIELDAATYGLVPTVMVV